MTDMIMIHINNMIWRLLFSCYTVSHVTHGTPKPRPLLQVLVRGIRHSFVSRTALCECGSLPPAATEQWTNRLGL